MQEDPRIAVARFVFGRSNIGFRLFVFLAAAGIFLDVWDLTAFSIVLVPFREVFHPTAAEIAFAVSSANIGAVAGALLGGSLTDKLGRKSMFIYSMLVFVVTAILQALSTGVAEFTLFRTLMGFGLGADVATGFSYIYEFIGSGERRKYYSLWAYAFSVTAIAAVLTTLISLQWSINIDTIWRIPFILGGIFAAVIIVLRFIIPETPIWLAYQGRYKEAARILRNIYGDVPESLPDEDSPRENFRVLKKFQDVFLSGRKKVLGFALSLNVIVGIVSWGFAFYVTFSLTSLGITSFTGALIYDLLIYGSALVGSILSPYLAGRLGTRVASVMPSLGICVTFFMAIFAVTHVIPVLWFVPLSAATLFLEYLGPMSYNALVNYAYPSSVRGSVNGVNYTVNKAVEAFTGYFGGFFLIAVAAWESISLLLALTLAFSVIALILGTNVFVLDPVDIEKEEVSREASLPGSESKI
ncbi:MAG: MFS transporter [Candidatus Thermoplasmatota archaeon]|nr:MFS transporter [Candidatus Thermoplasmatota archaeon]